LAETFDFGESLVLIRGESPADYASAAIYNPLDFQEAEPIYAWDRGAEVRAQVLAAYPDRKVWLVDGPSITKQGYKVVAGPLSADTLLSDLVQSNDQY
jgi:hypothetical protein